MSDEEIVNHIIGVGVRTQRKSYFPNLQEKQGELERRERLFSGVFDSAYQFMGIMDSDGRVIAINRTALEFVDATMEDVRGKFFWDTPWWTVPESNALLRTLVAQAIGGQQVRNATTTHFTPDGSRRIDVDFSITPVRNSNGDIEWLIAEGRDITERKRGEEELQKKNAALERFIYTVSHDLKTPLVTIKAFLGYLDEDLRGQKAELVDRDLGYIREAADKMWRLLDELLSLARVGHKMNDPVEVPLQDIVDEAITQVASQILARGVHMEATREPVWLYGDRPRLVEVFQNLIDNAVKFLGDQPAPRVEIGLEQSAGELVLFVRDNGKGIDPRHQSKLFGLFEKLDVSQPGTGIGLALVRRIIELHGGKIWVQSDGLAQGATFRFTLAKTRLKSNT